MTNRELPVAIIGAGPVGLAAAANMAVRNIPFILFEAGKTVGANIFTWKHVRVFSPWKYNIDKTAAKLLVQTKWIKPFEEALPTGQELIDLYLKPLSLHPAIQPFLRINARVLSITRRGFDKMKTDGREQVPFMIRIIEWGQIKTYEVSAVIDASGTWQNPNPIGASGIPAIGEAENARNITYSIPDTLGNDLSRYANKNVAVIGGGHSAINSLRDLVILKEKYPHSKLHWIFRTTNVSKIYGDGENDAFEARRALGIKIEHLVTSGALFIHSPYLIHEIVNVGSKLTTKGYEGSQYLEIQEIDEIIANTGSRPDLTILGEVRVQMDAAIECVSELADLIDPNVHNCGTVRTHGELELRQPESNFYIVGAKSYGRAPTFLMNIGYEQVRSVAAYLDGDLKAAHKAELNLPETGICNSVCASGSCCKPVQIGQPQTVSIVSLRSTSSVKNKNETIMKNETQSAKVNNKPIDGCCNGAPISNADACCKLDEEKKAEGSPGCGCTTTPETENKKKLACC